MISAWIRWRISSAIDKGLPISPSLARKVCRDPELRRFYEASLAMAVRLRRDADEVVCREQSRLSDIGHIALKQPCVKYAANSVRPRYIFWSCAAAALAVCAVLGSMVFNRNTSPEFNAMQPADMAELIQQMKVDIDRTIERSVPEWQRLISRSCDAVRDPLIREVENVKTDARNFLQAISYVSSMFSPEDPQQRPTPEEKGRPAQKGWETRSSAAKG